MLLGAWRRPAPSGTYRWPCGVGCGGPMTPGGEAVSPLNIPGWRGLPAAAIALADADRPARRVDNDAKALALGEGWRRRGRGASATTSAMVVSTGVGGGIVVDGRLLDGAIGQRRAHRPRHRRARRAGRARAAAGAASRRRSSGPAIEARTGRPAAEARRRDDRARPGCLVGRARRVGRGAARPPARRGRRLGRPRLRRAVLRRRAGRARPSGARIEFAARRRGSCPAGSVTTGPLVGAAAVGLRPWPRPPASDRAVTSARCSRPTRPRPRPTARRCRRSSPSTCPPTGRASARSRATTVDRRSRSSGARTLYENGFLALGWPTRVRRRRASPRSSR